MMKTILLNLPYQSNFVRRYKCSWETISYLPPPLELMYIGSIIKNWKKDEAILIDAVAENISARNVISKIKEINPSMLVTMIGFDSFKQDMDFLKKLKSDISNLTIFIFGYYPSLAPREVLENSVADYLMMIEPELTFSELYDCIIRKKQPVNVAGLAYKADDEVIINAERGRNLNLDKLPFPDRSLIRNNLYREVLFPRPFTALQTMRGCPYQCIYCVRTYGRKVAYRSVPNVLAEIDEIVYKYNIRNLKFIDDDFSCDKTRVIRLCQEIIKKTYRLNWTCLCRADEIDRELLQIMKKAGCRRIYIGVESGSQKILTYYKKGYDLQDIKRRLKSVRDIGIQLAGFFLIGGNGETEEDINDSIDLAKEINFDYIMIEKVKPYPGTELFENDRNSMNFSLFPYAHDYIKNGLEKQSFVWEKKFYRKVCFRKNFMIKKLRDLIKFPQESLMYIKELFAYSFVKKYFESKNMKL